MGARPPEPVVLLSQVHQLEVVREGADDRLNLLDRNLLQDAGELRRHFPPLLSRPAPPPDGQLAYALLQREQLGPLLFDDHLPKDSPQESDVAAQWLVGSWRHGFRSSTGVRCWDEAGALPDPLPT